jgi:hypothetical protein
MTLVTSRPLSSFENRTGNQDVNGRIYFVQNSGASYALGKNLTRGSRWRFEAKPGDYVLGQTDRIRSELQCSQKETVSGVDVWLSDWVYIEQPSGPLTADIGIGQFHQTEDAGDFSGFPPVIMEMGSGGLTVYTAFASSATQATSWAHTTRLTNYPFSTLTWHRRVMRCRFGWSNDAQLDLWLDGTQVINLTGINMGMNDTVGPYYKFGGYGEQNNEQWLAVQYANVELSATTLVSRVSTPIPVDY